MAASHHKSNYKDEALKAAKELCYGNEVQKKIRLAKTDEEIERIMATARKTKK